MIKDNEGQVAIEFILVVGAILTMVVVAAPMILKNAEMNRGLSAARDGATKAAAMRGLGYAGQGVDMQPAGVVKINNLTYSVVEIADAQDNVTITISAKIPNSMDGSKICSSIRTQAQRYIAYAFTGDWPAGAVVPLDDRTGSYYVFKVSCSPSS
jgi:hypothetical protein